MLCPSTLALHQCQHQHCLSQEFTPSGMAPGKKAGMETGDAGRGGREEGRVI